MCRRRHFGVSEGVKWGRERTRLNTAQHPISIARMRFVMAGKWRAHWFHIDWILFNRLFLCPYELLSSNLLRFLKNIRTLKLITIYYVTINAHVFVLILYWKQTDVWFLTCIVKSLITFVYSSIFGFVVYSFTNYLGHRIVYCTRLVLNHSDVFKWASDTMHF